MTTTIRRRYVGAPCGSTMNEHNQPIARPNSKLAFYDEMYSDDDADKNGPSGGFTATPRKSFATELPFAPLLKAASTEMRGSVAASEERDLEDDLRLLDSIQISNIHKINYTGLIQNMHDRFKKKSDKWEKRATMYARWAFLLNFSMLAMQMLQLLQTQFVDMFDFAPEKCRMCQGLLVTFTALIVGLQVKLKLLQKSERYRRGAKVYSRLRRTSTYYLMLLENGGRVDDITVLWRDAMEKESQHIPAVKTFTTT